MARSVTKRSSQNRAVRLKSIALPVEHGGWAFLVEPLLLGMLLTPSVAGLFLCVSAFSVFLIYQPLQIAMKDRRKYKRYPRTQLAERFAIGYGITAVLGLVGALLTAQAVFWLPIVAAAPFAGFQMLLALRGRARSAAGEISGSVALSASSAAIVMAKGWSPSEAFALWLLLAVCTSTSILYVRSRLRRMRGETSTAFLPLAADVVGLLAITVAVSFQLLPWTAVLVMVLLSIRAVFGLFFAHKPVRARVVGFQEIGYGLLTVLLVVLGYRL